MSAYSETFTAFQRQSLQSSQAIAMVSLAGFERLIELNVQAARASVEEGVQKGVSLLQREDAEAITEAFSDSPQPVGAKFIAYAKQVSDIVKETNADISGLVVKHFSAGNSGVTSSSVRARAKGAPAGSQGLGMLVSSAISATNATWAQVNKVNRQMLDMTAANAASVASSAGTAGKRKAA